MKLVDIGALHRVGPVACCTFRVLTRRRCQVECRNRWHGGGADARTGGRRRDSRGRLARPTAVYELNQVAASHSAMPTWRLDGSDLLLVGPALDAANANSSEFGGLGSGNQIVHIRNIGRFERKHKFNSFISFILTSMNVFITGGTGFIGRALMLRLRRDGHSVTALTRSVDKGRSLLGMEADLLEANASDEALVAALERADAVVNLAGEPVLGGRWDDEKKRRLRRSRVDLTESLVDAMAKTSTPPKVLVSGSAVGLYGSRGDEVLTEDSEPGTGFLADLCRDWEAAALKAEAGGTRVVLLRTGVVLGRGGGALDQMLPPFQFGLGGPLGSGTQYVPWIHLDDLIEMIVAAIGNESVSGPLNGSAPNPVTFRDFASGLGKVLSRPAFMPVPSFALKLLFGQAASVLLDSQRVVPERALAAGFQFRFPELGPALRDLLDNDFVEISRAEGPFPDSDYLRENPPAFVLKTEVRLEQSVEEVFPFFSRPENLGLITPSAMQFRITEKPDTMGAGALIKYRLKVGPVPLGWTTRIDVWEDGVRFVDSQLKGPYSGWWHEHRFERDGEGTLMTDRVYYSPPAGPIGRIANFVYVADELRKVFGYRSAIVRARFGADMR